MKAKDIIVGGEYAVGRPQGFYSLNRATVLRLGVAKAKATRSWRPETPPATPADWPEGAGVLVSYPGALAADAVVPLSHVHCTWTEHEAALAEAEAEVERREAADRERAARRAADDEAIRQALRDAGLYDSGDYRPASPLRDGRWSVDPTTLLLLLDTYVRARAQED